MLLALQLVVCSILLIPDQGTLSAGIEVLVLASAIWLVSATFSLRILRLAPPAERRHGRPAEPRLPPDRDAALPRRR